jgi:hypothetical protein
MDLTVSESMMRVSVAHGNNLFAIQVKYNVHSWINAKLAGNFFACFSKVQNDASTFLSFFFMIATIH